MKPLPTFTLHRPQTLEEALTLMGNLDEARPIAGGTDLIPSLKDGSIKAKHLVDLAEVNELKGIRLSEGELHIGAMTTLTQLVKSDLIKEKAPVLSEAAAHVGDMQIRNQGTLVGNLCNASPAADTAPPLFVLEANLNVQSIKGSRTIPVTGLFKGSKINSLKRGEMVTEVKLPIPPSDHGASFHKLGRRKGCTLSIVNTAVYLEKDGAVCKEMRVALGAVAATPLRIHEVEEKLIGGKLTRRVIERASSECYGLVKPVDDVRGSAQYRRDMTCVLTRRAIMEAWGKAGGA